MCIIFETSEKLHEFKFKIFELLICKRKTKHMQKTSLNLFVIFNFKMEILL